MLGALGIGDVDLPDRLAVLGDGTDEAADFVGRPGAAIGRRATFGTSGTCGTCGAGSSGSGDADTSGRDVPKVGESARPQAPGAGCEGLGVPGARPRPVAWLRRACASLDAAGRGAGLFQYPPAPSAYGSTNPATARVAAVEVTATAWALPPPRSRPRLIRSSTSPSVPASEARRVRRARASSDSTVR
ncbi:hypothetical protein ACIBJF_39130 [Streptomyces sp. NPDC050743]|uniref:hypothetical protein n=1 Tax=Streptomyces sp. NPDC050743 TaxID=3365634 RepID=UPI003787A4B7